MVKDNQTAEDKALSDELKDMELDDALDKIFVDKISPEDMKKNRDYKIKVFGREVVELKERIERLLNYISRLKKKVNDWEDYNKGCITLKAHQRQVDILQNLIDKNFAKSQKTEQALKERNKEEIEFYNNELWHLEEQYPSLPLKPSALRKEIKATINNIKRRLKHLQEKK